MAEPAGDGWYVGADDYWVDLAEAGEYPVRQGDLFGPVEVHGDEWEGAQIVHPTCEIPKKTVTRLQVIRVQSLDSVSDADHQARIVAGLQEKDQLVQVAFAHTFFLAPAPSDGTLAGPCFSNLRDIALLDRDQLAQETRVAAMTHDARLTFIRRKLYFRYRWYLPFDEVRQIEAQRIVADPNFHGPKPDWAQ